MSLRKAILPGLGLAVAGISSRSNSLSSKFGRSGAANPDVVKRTLKTFVSGPEDMPERRIETSSETWVGEDSSKSWMPSITHKSKGGAVCSKSRRSAIAGVLRSSGQY